jgi:hypothetical protein
MAIVYGIDPGPVQSAWLRLEDGRPVDFAIAPNEQFLAAARTDWDRCTVVIEKVESFGMSVGAEVFETVFWSGRFAEAIEQGRGKVVRLGRLKVKLALCHDSRAKDSNIRQALIDRFGGATAIGKKAQPGPLYGISKDVWSALAIAVTYADEQEGAAA